MDELLGQTFGQYQIKEKLGSGGMATVYRALQPNIDREVAVKVLARSLAADGAFVMRFKREARALAQLQHPHILQVFDFGEVDGYSFIVMPLVRSGTLSQRLRKGPLSLNQVRNIVTQIAEALGYAHARGIVHRDVKPSNVLLDESGNGLLSDFGVMHMRQANTVDLTHSGVVIGTPTYMSPEQANGDPVDARTDLYSLGVMLFEMVAGRVPYEAETPVQVLVKHAIAPLPSARALNPQLPRSLDAMLQRALAKKPSDRYQNSSQFVAALQAALPAGKEGRIMGGTGSVPTRGTPPRNTPPRSVQIGHDKTVVLLEDGDQASPTLSENAPSGSRRKPLMAALGLGALLLVGAGGAYALRQSAIAPAAAPTQQPTPVPTAQPLPTVVISTQPATATARPTATAIPVVAPTAMPTLTSVPGMTPVPATTKPEPTSTATSLPATATRVQASATPRPATATAPPPPTSTPPPPPSPTEPALASYGMPQLVSPNNNVGFDQNSIPLFSWSVAGTLGDRDYYRLEVTHLRGTDWLCTKSNRAQGRSYLAEVGARAWQLSVVQTEAGALEGSACNGTVLVTSGSRTLSGNMAGSGGPDGPGPTPRRPTATPPP